MLSIWASTGSTERHIMLIAKQQHWSMQTQKWDAKLLLKYNTADALHPGRWGGPTSYRCCVSFWKTSAEVAITRDIFGDDLPKAV